MNHSFACANDAQGKPTCERWCGNKHTCLSTMTYASERLQEAYEKGHFDAKWAMENELAKMAQTTSPHRRVAAEDFYRVLCKIRPIAFDIMPTAEAADSGVPRVSTARGCNPEEDGSPGDGTVPAAGNLRIAIEEAIASLEAGMVTGALETLQEALRTAALSAARPQGEK